MTRRKSNDDVRIEILAREDCPNRGMALVVVERVVGETGVPAVIEVVELESDSDAEEHRALGSPTVFVDGRDRIEVDCDCEAVIGGDAIIASIAAASIVAKVTRDRLMRRLGVLHPGYGFEHHKGYSVPEHFDALARLGPTIHHRRSFAPVAA